MKNKLIELLEQKQLGWSPDCVQTTGRKFVDLMTDVLWYTDVHAKTLESRSLAIPSLFSDFSGFNKPENHGHKQPPMEATKLRTYSLNLFRISEEPWLNKTRWLEVNQAIKAFASNLAFYCDYLDQQRKKATEHHQSLVPVRLPSEAESFRVLNPSLSTKPALIDRYRAFNSALQEAEELSPIFLNELCPHDVRQRRYYLDCLPDAVAVPAVMFSHAYGNNLGTHHFVWRVPVGSSPSDTLGRNTKAAQSIKDKIDVYHTRAMQKEATRTFGRICSIKPAFIREIYRRLTGDASASRTANEAEVDARIRLVLDCEDPSIVCDLREFNKGRPEKYSVFWEECQKYLENVTELAVQERRHGDTTYLAAALSARDLLTEVSNRCPEGTPVPSEAWLCYQFWPKDPSKQSASQYTGRLKVKHIVQARQLRKFHPDAHYASALYRYLRSLAVKFSSSCTFVSLDDKHHCKVGEPNYPVAAVERGKAVLVSLDKAFTVSDHDFTRFSLVPSVDLLMDIPATPDDSFHHNPYLGFNCFNQTNLCATLEVYIAHTL